MAHKVTAPERVISSMIGRTLAAALAARCDAWRLPWPQTASGCPRPLPWPLRLTARLLCAGRSLRAPSRRAPHTGALKIRIISGQLRMLADRAYVPERGTKRIADL
jgi:hypothetical protein